MAFERPITIKEAIENIHSKRYLLPAIQRELVWDVYQITRLFDSLMRDYPIGSFLFWHVEKHNVRSYQFYEFIRDFHERSSRHNPKANVGGQDDVTAVLDGQQRLTALYLSLKGSYAYKEPWKRWNNPAAFPVRRLYLNLLAPRDTAEQTEMLYDFAFLTENEVNADDQNSFWFRVDRILDIPEECEVNEFLIGQGVMDLPIEQKLFANRALYKLWNVVHKHQVINFFLEKDESLDKVLNIFIRVNSGGTVLSYSDLLLSIATAQWENLDAREVITTFVDELNDIGDGFNFDKDLVLKSSLVLSDLKDIAFKVDNFNRENMLEIERQWASIARALRGAITLVSSFGYTRETLTSNSSIIPIAYYLKQIESPASFDTAHRYAEDRGRIRRWLTASLVKRVFAASPDTVVRPIREVLRDSDNGFPLDRVVERFKLTARSLVFTTEDIEAMLEYRYGEGYTFSILALLYPSLDFRNRFHIDHIHPRSLFTCDKLRRGGISDEDVEFYQDHVNALPNLQLLEDLPNQEKGAAPFAEWLERNLGNESARSDYVRRHRIPDVELSLGGFKTFIEERRKLIREELRRLLLTEATEQE